MTVSYEVKPSDEIQGAAEVPYYVPEQSVPAGTFYQESPDQVAPKIFQPLKIGKLTLQNRIGVSPMCQYSADNFEATPYHLIHYGALLTRGPGITIVESAAVSHEGALSPHDLGIWTDEQAKKLKPIVDYAHSQKQLIAIQINHGGRKASGQPLYVHLEQIADESVGGFPDKIVAPSAIPFRPNGNFPTPNELTKVEIKRIINDFGDAARRAVEISGFDVIEIHGAHGYIINEFYSSVSNKRTDEYGGSFENRTRFLKEVIDNVKSKIPSDTPVFLRISATENSPDPEAWTIEDSKKLADILIEKGIDLLDVSSGGNDYRQPPRSGIAKLKKESLHLPLSRAIKQHVGDKLLVSSVGGYEQDPAEDNKYLEEGAFDLVLIGKGFLRDPGLVWTFADKLNVRLHQALQLGWGFWPNRQQIIDLNERSAQV
ncbi:NADPH dehydrogenase afvA [Candida viswanathii]|uniref:NADPH dehydrogenase afvA n=1 Tax=Candida viswanathii TaxID=5486 RepID=A0A367XYX7_9ASCO|nr:NADPH dehydrogenase afvA [Candida viswanathii]